MSEDLSEILVAVETGDDIILSKLENVVAQLLEKDPEKLIHALYRIDVDEKKFTVAIQSKTIDSAKAIALLLYERAIEKAVNKKNFKSDENISFEEKW